LSASRRPSMGRKIHLGKNKIYFESERIRRTHGREEEAYDGKG
jgi:hypothetical protein